ncbi:MAG: ParB/Srx family N-terminal domain-containing protein [Verrucomicrobiota bacterium]
MISWRYRLRLRVLGRREVVPLAKCVHYGAFRYGRSEPHPYETYNRTLAQGNRREARAWFIDFLRHYRPADFGAALGVDLERKHGLWHYPWLKAQPADNGWFDDPVGYPDIVTQFCLEGILWFRIEQEFFWLERSFYSIRRNGYRPELGDPIVAWRLVRRDGETAFLILDGNHRISALAALGHETVEVNYLPSFSVREEVAARWPQVANGNYSENEARTVFNAYFEGNSRWRTTTQPAALLETPE